MQKQQVEEPNHLKYDFNQQISSSSSSRLHQPEPSPDSEQAPTSKLKHTLLTIFRLLLLLTCLYMFVVSLDLMSASFRLVGGRSAGQVLSQSEIFTNPIAGVMVGVLATVLLQSSSTTTSIIVTMTGANILTVRQAAYLVMGANIGTSVTNTLVAMSQIGNPNEFELAFSGSTVHDVFNWLTVLCVLPLEAAFGILEAIINLITAGGLKESEGNKALKIEMMKVVTQPLTNLIVKLDSSIINDPNKLKNASTILKVCCDTSVVCINNSFVDCSNHTVKVCINNCTNAAMALRNASWSDGGIGALLLVASLISLTFCLVFLVKILKSLLGDTIKKQIRRITQSEKYGVAIGYICIVVGAVMTFLVQSSSVFTSAMTPLVGSGVIDLTVMYPLTLGSNIGTTITSLLAALASGTGPAMETSLIHLLFNLIGIIIWYPIPLLRSVPLGAAKLLGRTTYKYRWFAIAYLLLCFLLLPLGFFGLSLLHWSASVVAAVLMLLLAAAVGVINLLQDKRPHWLPETLRTWEWLPLPLRSLQPIDTLLRRAYNCVTCRKTDVAPHELHTEPNADTIVKGVTYI